MYCIYIHYYDYYNDNYYLHVYVYIYIYVIVIITPLLLLICICIYMYPHYITISLMSFSRLKEVCAVLEGVPRFIASLPVRGAENRRGLPQGLLTIINNNH